MPLIERQLPLDMTERGRLPRPGVQSSPEEKNVWMSRDVDPDGDTT